MLMMSRLVSKNKKHKKASIFFVSSCLRSVVYESLKFHLPWTLRNDVTSKEEDHYVQFLFLWVGCQGSTYSACNLLSYIKAPAIQKNFSLYCCCLRLLILTCLCLPSKQKKKLRSRMYDYLFSQKRKKNKIT